MKPTVHILATVRKDALLEGALLVFRTVRIGFPTATICVWGNGLSGRHAALLAEAARKAGGAFYNLPPTAHDAWIESLVQRSATPFWICDTDVVFWQSVEDWQPAAAFAGRYEPEFDEEFTRTRHVARLHTALMFIDPVAVRTALRQWMAKIPEIWRHTADFALLHQTFIPRRDEAPLFYDTMAGLYQAGFGEPFTEEQNKAFEHLHCGCYVDEVSATTSLVNLAAGHAAVHQNPELARGIQEQQNNYYYKRQPKGNPCPTNPE